MELDHVIAFVTGPDVADGLVPPGLLVDPGRRHTGQGTRNRRVPFADAYVELLWIDEPDAESRTGLGIASRCIAGASCPFGLVLRGQVPDRERHRFQTYRVPDGGPELLLLTASLADVAQPFVAVRESGVAPPLPATPVAIRHVDIRAPMVPDLGGLIIAGVTFDVGPAQLRVELAGTAENWVISG